MTLWPDAPFPASASDCSATGQPAAAGAPCSSKTIDANPPAKAGVFNPTTFTAERRESLLSDIAVARPQARREFPVNLERVMPAPSRPLDPKERRGVELAQRVLARDWRALARAITIIENDDPAAAALVAALYPNTGHAH